MWLKRINSTTNNTFNYDCHTDCEDCGPAKHCGCGIIGPKKIGDAPYPSPAKKKKSNEPRKTTKGKGRNFRTVKEGAGMTCLLYTSPSPRDRSVSRMPSSA